jgi:ABC-type lipoprotein release transport system permease subunit
VRQALPLFLALAWRNLWRNPRRTLITLAVVAVGMWSVLMFAAVLAAATASSRDTTLKFLTGHGQIHATGYLDDPNVTRRLPPPAGALGAVLGAPPVRAWTPRVRVPAIVRSEYRTRAVTLVGVVPENERVLSLLPRQVASGRYLMDRSDVGLVMGRDLAARLRTRIGKRVIVMAQAADGHLAEAGLRIVGLYAAGRPAEDEFLFTGLASAQAMLGLGAEVSEISFEVADERALPAVVAALRRAAPALDVEPWMVLAPLVYTLETFSRYYTAVWLLIMFVLMAIGIVNTQLMAVFERRREFGLLQALGMRPHLIVLEVVLESVLLVGLGVLAGTALGALALAPFRGGLDLGFLAPGAELMGESRVLHPQLLAGDALCYGLVVWLLGIAAALWPARNAARAAPVTAMSSA